MSHTPDHQEPEVGLIYILFIISSLLARCRRRFFFLAGLLGSRRRFVGEGGTISPLFFFLFKKEINFAGRHD